MQIVKSDILDSVEFLNLILESIPSAVFVIDKDRRVHNVNQAFSQFFHCDEDDVIGQLCGNAMGCEFAVESGGLCGTSEHCRSCALKSTITDVISTNSSNFKRKLSRRYFLGDDPVDKHFYFTTRPITFHGERMVIIIIEDITTLEDQRLQLESLNEEKNTFLGMAAHDLRTPISIITMYTGSFLEHFSENLSIEQRDFLTVIRKSSAYMLNLVEDLLDVTVIESGKLVLNTSCFDYEDLIRQVFQLNDYIAAKKNISQHLEIEPGEYLIEADSHRLTQVLNNLTSNALKFTPSGGKISIRVWEQDSQIMTSVQDTGPGIPEDEVKILFKPFQVTTIKSTDGEKQSGLGLAIAMRIVLEHGGWLDVVSPEGEGARFTFSLPKTKTDCLSGR